MECQNQADSCWVGTSHVGPFYANQTLRNLEKVWIKKKIFIINNDYRSPPHRYLHPRTFVSVTFSVSSAPNNHWKYERSGMIKHYGKYLNRNWLLLEQENDLIMLNARDGLKAVGVTKVVGLTRGKTVARTAGTREDFKVFINCISLKIVFIYI